MMKFSDAQGIVAAVYSDSLLEERGGQGRGRQVAGSVRV